MADEERHRQARLFTTDDGEFDRERAESEALPVEDGEVVHTDDLADHQRYVEGRGVYDERNDLNDLTGREWKYATKSVLERQHPPDLQHDLRSQHGGQKPPRLCRELIERFSQSGERVLDPFAGVGGTLLGASLAEHEGTGLRDAVGFEIGAEWIDVYETVLERENTDRAGRGAAPLAEQEFRHGDCLDLVDDVADDAVDLLLTDVPYWNMDRVEQTRNEAETRESKLGAFDGDSPVRDRETWLAEMRERFRAFQRVLADGRYAVVFIGDMYREERYHTLSADLGNALEEVGYTLKANLVWYDSSKELHVYGYPFSFVPSMVHQNVLVLKN
ncbi:DNA methyltransferase [Halobaculum sp. MBLA0143]|uniref:DNA methyltransferase n=1 Tax=Halobaculum sp. MBLA0143 TaxID=3079933 RepID=UPI0035246CC5